MPAAEKIERVRGGSGVLEEGQDANRQINEDDQGKI